MLKATKTVDAYISSASRTARPMLAQMRALIKKVAPEATERMSYGMPYYGYNGRFAYFALAKTHVGLYIPTPVLAMHAKDLKGYSISTATVRFPLDKKLPVMLITKLLKTRKKLNNG